MSIFSFLTVSPPPHTHSPPPWPKATGLPLLDYLQNLRMVHGKHLLETTHLPVEAISEAAGYSDASFFRRLFKRLVDLNPLTYRRMFSHSAGLQLGKQPQLINN